MTSTFNAIEYAADGPIATIILNRPRVLNAINRQMHREWCEALALAAAAPEVRVVVLRGAGRAFSAGHDLKQDVDLPLRHPEEWRAALAETMELAFTVWDFPKPVVASVHGYCLGKACQVALACDFVLASEDATFGEPEVRSVTTSAFPILPWVAGIRRAKELLMLGRTMSGRDAAQAGMINAAYPADRLAGETRALADELATVPPAALRLNKRAINHALELMGLRANGAWNLELVSLTVAREFEVESSTDFDTIRREQGLKAALAARDGDARTGM
jgi:enoyl-CoA hydratase/carnithine racemase